MVDVSWHFETPLKKEMFMQGFLNAESMETALNKLKREKFIDAVLLYVEHKNNLMHLKPQEYYCTLKKENAIKRLRDFLNWCKGEELPSLLLICQMFLYPEMKEYLKALLPGNDEVQKNFLRGLFEFAKQESAKVKEQIAA